MRRLCRNVGLLVLFTVGLALLWVKAQQSHLPRTDVSPERVWAALRDAEEKLAKNQLRRRSLKEDMRLGRHAAKEKIKELKARIVPTPPYLEQLLQFIVSRLTEKHAPSYQFRVVIFLADDSQYINRGAALADGTIFFTDTSIYRVRSEAELVGFLVHELTHILRRHQNAWTTLGGYLAARGFSYNEIQTVVYDEENPRSFIFRMQLEADKAALAFLKNAGYDPCAHWKNNAMGHSAYGRFYEALRDTYACGGALSRIAAPEAFERFRTAFALASGQKHRELHLPTTPR